MEIGTEITVAIITGVFSLAGIWLAAKLKDPNTSSSQGGGSGGAGSSGQPPIIQAVKSAKFAAVMSFFFPGIGELYLGQSKKGLTIFIVAIILGGGTMGVVWFALGIYSSFHAHKIGCLLARGLPIRAWE